MKFEYNENLSLMEKTELVATEIKKQYPEIDDLPVVMSALLSSPVDDKPTNDEKFERYYYILKHLDTKNEEYLHVFNDLYNVYEDGLESKPYNECMEAIIKFVAKETTIFPDLADYIC